MSNDASKETDSSPEHISKARKPECNLSGQIKIDPKILKKLAPTEFSASPENNQDESIGINLDNGQVANGKNKLTEVSARKLENTLPAKATTPLPEHYEKPPLASPILTQNRDMLSKEATNQTRGQALNPGRELDRLLAPKPHINLQKVAPPELHKQPLRQPQSGIPENMRQKLDADAEHLRHEGFIDESGNWHFQNPSAKPGQDIAGKVKEALWNTFIPSPGKTPKNNAEFLYQFLTGTGKTIQEHTDKNDPVLKDFMQSPGAAAIRKQFAHQGFPPSTDKLGYGTWQAFEETVAPEAKQTTPSGLPVWTNFKDWGSVAAQVGGFGNPPKNSETPWARASAMRTDADGKPDPHGTFVQFQIINVAGLHSFNLHLPGMNDRPLGDTGSERSIIQTFRWVELIKVDK